MPAKSRSKIGDHVPRETTHGDGERARALQGSRHALRDAPPSSPCSSRRSPSRAAPRSRRSQDPPPASDGLDGGSRSGTIGGGKTDGGVGGNQTGCSEAAKLVYVVSRSRTSSSASRPTRRTFTKIGELKCPGRRDAELDGRRSHGHRVGELLGRRPLQGQHDRRLLCRRRATFRRIRSGFHTLRNGLRDERRDLRRRRRSTSSASRASTAARASRRSISRR